MADEPQPRQTPDFDSAVSIRLAGVVVLALVGVFALHALGFRFVVSASGRISP